MSIRQGAHADAGKGSSSQELKLKENVPSFHFPSEETHSELRKEWVKFVNRPSSNWKPSKSSLICIKHFSIDEMQDFKENDTISSFEELNEKHSPPGFQFRKTDDCVLYYNLQFDEKTSFPKVLEYIIRVCTI